MAKKNDDSDLNSEEKKLPVRRPKRKAKKPTRSRDLAEQLVKNALEDHMEYLATKRLKDERDIGMLSSIIEEYLENFIILGYDYKGDSIQLISANSQQQADALGTSIHRFLIKNSFGGPPGSPM